METTANEIENAEIDITEEIAELEEMVTTGELDAQTALLLDRLHDDVEPAEAKQPRLSPADDNIFSEAGAALTLKKLKKAAKNLFWDNSRVSYDLDYANNLASDAYIALFDRFTKAEKFTNPVPAWSYLKNLIVNAAEQAHLIQRSFNPIDITKNPNTECQVCDWEGLFTDAAWTKQNISSGEWEPAKAGVREKGQWMRATCPCCGARLQTDKKSTIRKQVALEVENEDGEEVYTHSPITFHPEFDGMENGCSWGTVQEGDAAETVRLEANSQAACADLEEYYHLGSDIVKAVLTGRMEQKTDQQIAKELGITGAKLS